MVIHAFLSTAMSTDGLDIGQKVRRCRSKRTYHPTSLSAIAVAPGSYLRREPSKKHGRKLELRIAAMARNPTAFETSGDGLPQPTPWVSTVLLLVGMRTRSRRFAKNFKI